MGNSVQSLALTVFLFVACSARTEAQLDLSKWQIGVNGGMFIYQGDLSPETFGSYKTVQPVAGLYVSRILNPSFLLRTNLAIGKLYGNDAKYNTPEWRQQRNYSFTTPVTEISELLVWNIAGNNSNELGQRFSPYVFAGAGVSFLKISRDYSRFNSHYFSFSSTIESGLNADISRTPPRATLVIPMGLGMEFYLTPKLSLTAETNFRYTTTDYLDGFSLGANPDRNDFYHSNTIGLVYRFGKGNKLGCPVIKK